MKILHLADLHLGKKLSGYDLMEDQKEALHQIGALLEREASLPEGLGFVAITGDVYQSSMPTGAALSAMTEFLDRVSQTKVPVFMLSGNHDSDARISYLSPLLEKSNVYVTTAFRGVLETRTLQDEEGEVDVHMLPFIKPVQVKAFYPEEDIVTYEDALRCVIAHSPIDPKKRNILLAHQCVTGAEEAGSEERIIGGSEDVGLKVFEPFDLVLLGHIHRPQLIKKEGPMVSYAGSLLGYSAKEIGQEKSLSLITLPGKGETPSLRRVPYPVRRKIRQVEGYFEDLMAISPTEDLVSVVLLDERPPLDYVVSLRSVFRCLLEVRVKNAAGIFTAVAVEKEEIDLEEKDDLALFEDFFAWTLGKEMAPDEKELMQKLIESTNEKNPS